MKKYILVLFACVSLIFTGCSSASVSSSIIEEEEEKIEIIETEENGDVLKAQYIKFTDEHLDVPRSIKLKIFYTTENEDSNMIKEVTQISATNDYDSWIAVGTVAIKSVQYTSEENTAADIVFGYQASIGSGYADYDGIVTLEG